MCTYDVSNVQSHIWCVCDWYFRMKTVDIDLFFILLFSSENGIFALIFPFYVCSFVHSRAKLSTTHNKQIKFNPKHTIIINNNDEYERRKMKKQKRISSEWIHGWTGESCFESKQQQKKNVNQHAQQYWHYIFLYLSFHLSFDGIFFFFFCTHSAFLVLVLVVPRICLHLS